MVDKLRDLIPAGGAPYIEPFAGAASMLWSREPAPVEVINDLDGDLVNLFRCLQNPATFEPLRHRLMWTPYAKAELARAIEIRDSDERDPVLRAWAFFVAQNMGMGGKSPKQASSWGRTFTSAGGMASATNSWLMRLSMLDALRWRLMRVQIERRDALEAIAYWDSPDAVMYIDPPYHHATRKTRQVYAVESAHGDHERLVQLLLGLKGAATVSGYDHPVYAPLAQAGWRVVDFATVCHAAGRTRNSGLRGAGAARAKVPRVERAWINPRACELLAKQSLPALDSQAHQPLNFSKP